MSVHDYDDDSGDPDDPGDPGDPDRTVRDEPPRRGSFLCDVMLGSLVTYLRMCGYDAAYALDRGIEDDDRLLELAREERRTLLTRDRRLAARASNAEDTDTDGPPARSGGLLLDSRAVTEQLRELRAAGYDLALAENPARCGRCNGRVERVSEYEITPEYAPSIQEEAVWRCVECDQHFWKGSHWDSVERTLAAL